MVISLQELRKQHQEETRQQQVDKPGRFPWQEDKPEGKQGVLKFARYLASN